MKKEPQLFGTIHTCKRERPNRKIKWVEKQETRTYQADGEIIITTITKRKK